MKTILIISEDKETVTTIESCFSSDSRVVSAGGIDPALVILREKRYDFTFVDLTILRASMPGDDYKTAFEPFRKLYATIQIIVLAPKNKVDEAINAKLAASMSTPMGSTAGRL